jgi:hypothetical protein
VLERIERGRDSPYGTALAALAENMPR